MESRTLLFWHGCFLLSSQTSKQTQSSPCCVTGSASLEGKSTLPLVIPTFTVMPRVDIPPHGNDRCSEPTAISMDTGSNNSRITVSPGMVSSVRVSFLRACSEVLAGQHGCVYALD